MRRAAQSLGADVVHINFEMGFDVMGFDAIFFNIVLTDEASRPARLRFLAQHVALTLMYQLKSDENGVHAYFNFRSHSEVASIKDPAWASDVPVALANDLLEQAYHLARKEPKRPRQASLRRAISTSYYALFHLLISEATRNWKQSSQRPALGPIFPTWQHGEGIG